MSDVITKVGKRIGRPRDWMGRPVVYPGKTDDPCAMNWDEVFKKEPKPDATQIRNEQEDYQPQHQGDTTGRHQNPKRSRAKYNDTEELGQ